MKKQIKKFNEFVNEEFKSHFDINNGSYNKQTLIDALDNLDDAFIQLEDEWMLNRHIEGHEGEKLYPFESSFDDFYMEKVRPWIKSFKEELK